MIFGTWFWSSRQQSDRCVSLIWRVFDRDVNDVSTVNHWLMKRTHAHKSLQSTNWSRADGGDCNMLTPINEIQLLQCRNETFIITSNGNKLKWNKRVRAYNTSHSSASYVYAILIHAMRQNASQRHEKVKRQNNRHSTQPPAQILEYYGKLWHKKVSRDDHYLEHVGFKGAVQTKTAVVVNEHVIHSVDTFLLCALAGHRIATAIAISFIDPILCYITRKLDQNMQTTP